ncbi:hypothetical protein J437_LFUL007637 [Ladona fulva]|uniref:Uncharacterized protein n=1 Tax=Ladona fulva TaxID=123851 RepID=A0A8K0JTD7_LADFU|nr:hypothetical protein J437_LFUL007637 [Ladona fulva]
MDRERRGRHGPRESSPSEAATKGDTIPSSHYYHQHIYSSQQQQQQQPPQPRAKSGEEESSKDPEEASEVVEVETGGASLGAGGGRRRKKTPAPNPSVAPQGASQEILERGGAGRRSPPPNHRSLRRPLHPLNAGSKLYARSLDGGGGGGSAYQTPYHPTPHHLPQLHHHQHQGSLPGSGGAGLSDTPTSENASDATLTDSELALARDSTLLVQNGKRCPLQELSDLLRP